MITAGEVFKRYREQTEKSLEEVAQDTKIQKRFLEYLESNEYERFDSDIFVQGFIKIYSNYLGLNEDKMLALYRRTKPNIVTKKEKRENRKKKILQDFKISFTPKTISIFVSSVLLLSILIYIGIQIYKFQSPPNIRISSPQNDFISKEEEIQIEGETDINTTVTINETNLVDTDEDGKFSQNIKLNPGVNIITIVASKNNNTLETVETIKVTYEAEIEETEDVEEEITVNKLRLEIINSSAWIQFNVDKENKISQILQAGESFEYEVEETFSLTTGRIANTLIYFNDTSISIPTTSGNIGQLTCSINEDNQIDCE